MLSNQEKKEMLKDALSRKRRMAFETADKKAQPFIQEQLSSLTVDRVIDFLMNVQKVTGPFPISKNAPDTTGDLRL